MKLITSAIFASIASIALIASIGTASAQQGSCQQYLSGCLRDYNGPGETQKCHAATNRCVAQCKNGKSVWVGFKTGTRFPVSC